MPQFMMMLKTRETQGPPPPELFVAMDKYIAEAVAGGGFVSMGGLLPSALGAEVTVADGKVIASHGPFAETTELVGGYAVFEYDTLEQAITQCEAFVQLHVDTWPGWQGTSEIRQIMDQG